MERAKVLARAIGIGLAAVLAITLLAAAVEFTASYGSSIDLGRIDGVLGSDWDDAQRHECRMGKYAAEVYLKYDDGFFYVAMVIHTSKEIRGTFEAWVFFDDGDGKGYEKGDDMLSVVADGGKREKADYYFEGKHDFVLDTRGGGENNATGAGRYDDVGKAYTFEFRRELASGDAKDVQIEDEAIVDIEYGWSSY